MAINYAFTAEGNLLVVTAAGFDESLQEVQQYGLAIIQECLRGSFTAVLCIESALEYRLGTMDIFKLAEFITEEAPMLARAAIVYNENYAEDARFWETVVVNRGLMFRVFKDAGEARSWLGNANFARILAC